MKRWKISYAGYKNSQPDESNPNLWNRNLNVWRRKIILDLLNGHSGTTLDIGGGRGHISAALAAQNKRVYIIDAISELLAEAREKGLVALQADLDENLPIRSASVQVVIAGEIIEHIYDTDKFILEIKRVMAPGGVLIVTVPNVCSLASRIKVLFGQMPHWIDNRDCHIRAYNQKAIVDQLKFHGFKIEKIKTSFIFIPVLRIFLKWVFPFWVNLGENIVVKARK